VLDCIILKSVDTTFDLLWRRGTTDTTLATWTEHYDPLPGGSFDAQPFEYDMPAPAIDFMPGDQLVFRYTGNGTTLTDAYIPNGDGKRSKGRIPNITLPQ
jgi:hypothetical protein